MLCFHKEYIAKGFLLMNTRTQESEQLLRGITGKVLSFDATYKATKKATISTARNAARQKPFETLVTMITEHNLIASWRFTFTETLLEVQAQLRDLRERFTVLRVPPPCQVVVDNCCTVRNKVQEILPEAAVGLDVYHYSVRYTRTLKASHAHLTSAIGSEIVSALLSETAESSATGRAQYRKKEDQARLMDACVRKWKKLGAFSSAVDPVHETGMKHIQKGCLERSVEDVRSDGSRIENTNRGWNGIARSVPGGLEGFLNQAHDWVLRRNIRLAFNSKVVTSISDFVSTTFGSHQVSLVSESTRLWNTIIQTNELTYPVLPTLQSAQIDEHFGLVCPTDGTFGVKSTEDIDYLGFEETLLFADVVKQEFADLDHLQSLGEEVACNPESVQQVSTHPPTIPATSNQRKRSLSPEASNSGGICESSKRQRPLLPVDELDGPEETPMELLPDGQELGDYLQMESTSTGSTPLPDTMPAQTSEPQPNTPIQSSSRPPPFMFVPPPHPPLHPIPKPQHLFFGRFPKNSQTPDPAISVQPSPLITPRVLLRPSSQTTRHSRSGSTPGIPVTQPTNATTVGTSEKARTPKDHTDASLPQTVLSISSDASQTPNTPAATARSGPQVVALASEPQPLPSDPNQNEQAFRNGPSQQTFRRLTRLDPEALKFQDGDFLIMMDLRAEHKWDSRRMGSGEWAEAVQLFNKRRQEKKSHHIVPIQGNIFQEELLKAERMISQRLLIGDFKARSSGSESFWRKHCSAVPGFGPGESGSPATMTQYLAGPSGTAGPSNIKGKGKVKLNKSGAERKPQVCRRCGEEKYPGGTTNKQLNHKKSECSDGVSPSLKDVPYPLPSGIISEKRFKVDNFRQQCSRIQKKQAEGQSLSREEQNLLAWYSKRVVEDLEGATCFAF
ncbi:hypothetical protein FRC01_003198, partial [Tulasnella sp. 417]